MTSADTPDAPDIPERLEWRCMLPVRFVREVADKLQFVVSYNSTGLDIAKEIVAAGIKQRAALYFILQWFQHETEDHHVEFVGGLHGSGWFFGHDRRTGEVRSLWHDMQYLGYAVEDDE
jgi:hypothetical protein